jgi:glucose/arabinose dehydrogenase
MALRTSQFALPALALLLAPTLASAQGNPPLDTVRVASGLARPVFVTAPVGDTSRIFIVEQRTSNIGQIRILNLPGNTLQAAPYLSISPVATGNEQGLLGLAFHPDFANNGYFYVNYNNASGTTIIARYQANAPFATSTSADAASATPVLSIAQPFSNHNGGWLAFGPDGFLYIGMGDGGSANDPGNRAQTITGQLLGKMLRIDVNGDDFPADAARNYAIPPTNPFAGATVGDDEIWHYGLRNPWRNSFDRATGDLWIGDVGQNAIEEISLQPAGMGGLNYGWRCMEGFNCTGLSGCTCNGPTLTLPVHAYPHSGGACSVTGGVVYRGSAICGLQGTYFFADYCNSQIWSFRYAGAPNPTITNRTTELAPGGGFAINNPSSFGEDANGEVYICDLGGEVFKIVPGTITDCNANGVHDGCDIAGGTSQDQNQNGVPDECESSITPYCFGVLPGLPSPCPCGNAGLPTNGCANSVNANGANLAGTGTASLSNDSLTLVGTGMPDAPALYFQGTTQTNGGLGLGFGDGLRCAGGTNVRLGQLTNFNGQSSYPGILDPQISVSGGITGGPQTRTYQVWYRNANPTFCTADTWNLTNALSVVWVN